MELPVLATVVSALVAACFAEACSVGGCQEVPQGATTALAGGSEALHESFGAVWHSGLGCDACVPKVDAVLLFASFLKRFPFTMLEFRIL